MNKPFWQRRLSVVEAIYAELILEGMDSSTVDISHRSEWEDFERTVFGDYLENGARYEKIISRYLRDDWNLRRINYMAVAVLFEALSEFHSWGTPPNVLIEQSVKTVKNYCGNEEYKLVNGVLHNCLKDLGGENKI